MLDNDIARQIEIRELVLKTKNIKIEEKRKILENFDILTSEELEKVYLRCINDEKNNLNNISKKQKLWFDILMIFKNIFKSINNIFGRSLFIKTVIIITVVFGTRTIYSNPSGINVNGFVGIVGKVRVSLGLLKDKAPLAYELVKNNVYEINIDYVENPSNKGGHALNREGKTIVRIYNPELNEIRIAGLLVHEACHGKQFNGINGSRFDNESSQKLENECTYLQIYILELLGEKDDIINHIKTLANETNGNWGNGWKKSWEGGDTTEGLMNILPEKKQKEYMVFGDNYDYK